MRSRSSGRAPDRGSDRSSDGSSDGSSNRSSNGSSDGSSYGSCNGSSDLSSDLGPAAPPDPLSQVLADLRPSGVSYGRCELTRPWGIDFPPQAEARFHFVAEGDCWLRAPSREWIHL